MVYASRLPNEKAKIAQAKRKSKDGRYCLILEEKENETYRPREYALREFFRFEDGELVEYDLTKFMGKDITLSEEEKQGMEECLKEQC